jgi:hypothetical protein
LTKNSFNDKDSENNNINRFNTKGFSVLNNNQENYSSDDNKNPSYMMPTFSSVSKKFFLFNYQN